MRVQTLSIDDFFENLDSVEGLYDNAIRVSVSKNEVGSSGAVFDVYVQASAVVRSDGAEYLLDLTCKAGRDYEDSSQDYSGTEQAVRLKGRIREFAHSKGWRVLPGLVSE